MFRIGIVAALVAIASMPTGASAQKLALSAGVLSYDLSGTGSTPVVSVGTRFGQRLAVVPRLSAARYRSQSGTPVTLLMPEIQAELALRQSGVIPYLGVGVGAMLSARDSFSDRQLEEMLSAAGGVRVPVTRSWSVGAEMRLRSFGSFTGSATEWSLGVIRRF